MKTLKASEEFVVGKHNIGYVDSDFIKYFGNTIFEPVSAPPTFQKLTRRMTDARIENGDLGRKPGLSTLGDVLVVLDSDSPDYRDRNFNIFYFGACVVSVRWSGGEWYVSAWDRDGGGWNPGSRVFSSSSETVRSSRIYNPTKECWREMKRRCDDWDDSYRFRAVRTLSVDAQNPAPSSSDTLALEQRIADLEAWKLKVDKVLRI